MSGFGVGFQPRPLCASTLCGPLNHTSIAHGTCTCQLYAWFTIVLWLRKLGLRAPGVVDLLVIHAVVREGELEGNAEAPAGWFNIEDGELSMPLSYHHAGNRCLKILLRRGGQVSSLWKCRSQQRACKERPRSFTSMMRS